jgi:hypothetical protein
MKTCNILICALLLFTQLHAQKTRSAFRKGYQRIGISTLGNKLDNDLSPKENVFNGNYGAGTGFVFESGHIYYFKSTKSNSKINYGLDWTITSITYNKLNDWEDYGNASGAENVTIDGSKLSMAFASKLGPVISFNPIEKLIIDVHFQVAPTARITDLEYYEDEDKSSVRSFTFYNYGEEAIDENYDAKSLKNVLSFGVGTNFGISVRRKAIGLALDYTSVNAKTNYDAYEGEDNHTFGKEKIKTNSLQLKLSISL